MKYINKLFSFRKTPAQLVKIRKINRSNDDLMSGVIRTYMQMNDPKVANEILKESLSHLKKK